MNIITALKDDVDSQANNTKIMVDAINLQIKHQADFTFRKAMNEFEPIRSDVLLMKSRESVQPADIDSRISKANSRFFEELTRMNKDVAHLRQTS